MSNRFLNRFLAFQGSQPLTLPLLDQYRASLTLSPASINRHLGPLKAWLRHMHARDELPFELAKAMYLLKPERVDKPLPAVLGTDEIRALLKTAAKRRRKGAQTLRAFLLASLITGARPGELEALQPESIKPGHVEIWGSKTGRGRIVQFQHSRYAQAFFATMREAGPIGRVRDESWHALCRLAGLPPLERRILRATAASYMACSGMPLALYAAQLGHSLQVAQQHYLNPRFHATGKYLEEWMGADVEFAQCLDEYTRASSRHRLQPAQPA